MLLISVAICGPGNNVKRSKKGRKQMRGKLHNWLGAGQKMQQVFALETCKHRYLPSAIRLMVFYEHRESTMTLIFSTRVPRCRDDDDKKRSCSVAHESMIGFEHNVSKSCHHLYSDPGTNKHQEREYTAPTVHAQARNPNGGPRPNPIISRHQCSMGSLVYHDDQRPRIDPPKENTRIASALQRHGHTPIANLCHCSASSSSSSRENSERNV